MNATFARILLAGFDKLLTGKYCNYMRYSIVSAALRNTFIPSPATNGEVKWSVSLDDTYSGMLSQAKFKEEKLLVGPTTLQSAPTEGNADKRQPII